MAELINIKNKSTFSGEGEYIGRGSPLGNPFKISEDLSRHMAIHRYAVWFKINLDGMYIHEINRLFTILCSKQKLTLICHCFPKECHGDIIKQVLENKFYTGSYLVGGKIGIYGL